jgi:ATP-dependent protease ClpP protease subunit
LVARAKETLQGLQRLLQGLQGNFTGDESAGSIALKQRNTTMLYWYEQDKKTAVIKFYADISYWRNDASYFTALFEALDAKYDFIIIRVHCYGGDVMEGNAMYNCLAGSSAHTTWRIEGVCMSMGSIIMIPCDEIEMCDNGILMIHEPVGGTYGNEKAMLAAAKCLGIMKKNASKAYATKTGLTAKDIMDTYFEGSDHYMDAEEALAKGFITKIVPAVVKSVKDLPLPAVDDEQPFDYAAAYNRYAALLDMKEDNEQEYTPGMRITKRRPAKAQAKPENTDTLKTDIEMKKMLIALLQLKGVDENTPDQEFAAAVKAHFDAKGTSSTTTPEAEAKASAESFVAAIEQVTGKTFEAAERSNLVTIGEKAGLSVLAATMKTVVPAQTATPETPETPNTPELKTLVTGAQGTAGKPESRANWDWEAWQKNDPKGLTAMEDNDPKAFAALYKAEFGVMPG